MSRARCGGELFIAKHYNPIIRRVLIRNNVDNMTVVLIGNSGMVIYFLSHCIR